MLRIFFLILVWISFHQAAEIDRRFFSTPEDKKAFLLQMETNATQDENKEIAAIEIALLQKIKTQDKEKPSIAYQKEVLDLNKTISLEVFEQKIERYVDAKIQQQESIAKIIQSTEKLDYIRNEIRNITVENKANLETYQLQYTLYRQILEFETQKVGMYDEVIRHNELLFKDMLPNLQTDVYEKLLIEQKKEEERLNELKKKLAELVVKIEYDQLVESKQTEMLQSEHQKLLDALNHQYIITAKTTMQIGIIEILLKKNNDLIISKKKLVEYIASVTSDEKKVLEVRYELFRLIGKNYAGITSVAMFLSKESIYDTLNYIGSLLSKTLFVLNEKAVTSMDIIKMLIIFVIGVFIASFYRRRVRTWSSKSTAMSAKVMANFGYYFIVVITFFIAINSVGIDLSSLSMFASALAIGIGFGLQTVVSNMVSGIIMMFERSIRIGDFVEITDVLRGTVTDMRIRSTVIKTLDNIDIVVPNSSFIQNNVINLTLDDAMRRLHIPFGVAYGTEVEKVQQAVLSELEQSTLNYYKGFDTDRHPIVRMTGMGASSVDYELLVWIDWFGKEKAAGRSDFLILIYKALYKHEIEIPFPQMDLHLKTLEQALPMIEKE